MATAQITEASLNEDQQYFSTNNDGIVIVKALADLPGGRAISKTGTYEGIVYAGTIIIKKKRTQGEGDDYIALGIKDNKYPFEEGATYEELKDGETAVGILKATVRIHTQKAIGAIVTMGQIREKAMPAAVPDSVKEKLPYIQFI